MEFGKVEMLESYGEEYFKIRVPKADKSIGFVFGLIETIKKKSIVGISEYSVGQTTLEMIFNYFAKGGKGGQNIDQEMNEANGSTNQTAYQLTKDQIRCQRVQNGAVSMTQLSIKDASFDNFKKHLSKNVLYSIN